MQLKLDAKKDGDAEALTLKKTKPKQPQQPTVRHPV
jgi:hypothetical protein